MDELDDPCIEAMGMLIEAHNEVTNATVCELPTVTKAPLPWFGVLVRLARSPGGQLRMTELARDMTISTSGLTRLVDRLEAAGHVERRSCPEDRRGLNAVITPRGREALEAALPGHVASLHHIFRTLDADELGTLVDLLRRVRNGVRDASA